MNELLLQCCYTNAQSNEGLMSGWRPVAVSETIPPDVYDECVQLLARNSNIKGRVIGRDNKDLSLLEIVGGKKCLFVIRTKYGLKDRRKRRNIFSHAYLLSLTDNLLLDPNRYVCLSKNSFATSIEEAKRSLDLLERGKVPQIGESFDACSAMEAAGIRSEKMLADLVGAVYSQVSNAGGAVYEPLYVQCEDERKAFATLYCIYAFLPLRVRRKLVCTSAECGNNEANVVLSSTATRHQYSFDATDLALPLRNIPGKPPTYVEHAVRRARESDFDLKKYFEDLEIKAKALNVEVKIHSQEARLYRVAYWLLELDMDKKSLRNYSPDELRIMLDDALSLKSRGSEALDRYLAAIVREYTERGLELNMYNDSDLRGMIGSDYTSELEEAMGEYDMAIFARLSADKAIRKLAEAEGTQMFEKYESYLLDPERGGPKGFELLDDYYDWKVRLEEQPTWDKLRDYLDRSKYICDHRPQTDKTVRDIAFRLYLSSLADIEEVSWAYDSYHSVISAMDGSDLAELERKAKDEFWQRVHLNDISVEQAATYRKMNNENVTAKLVIDDLDVVDSLIGKGGSEEAFLRRFHKYCKQCASKQLDFDRNNVVERFKGYVKSGYKGEDTYLGDWINLVSLISRTPILSLLLQTRQTLTKSKFSSRDFKELCNNLKEYFNALRSENTAKSENAAIRPSRNLFIKRCFEIDESNAEPVEIDVWLTLGSEITPRSLGGPFLVFDYEKERTQRILSSSPEQVFKHTAMDMADYGYARQYLDRLKEEHRENTPQWSAVHSWVDYNDKLISSGSNGDAEVYSVFDEERHFEEAQTEGEGRPTLRRRFGRNRKK